MKMDTVKLVWTRRLDLCKVVFLLILVIAILSFTLLKMKQENNKIQSELLRLRNRNPTLNVKQEHGPLIICITPTYYRLAQRADLTRLSNTLRNVPNLHWIIVEDSNTTNLHINQLLVATGIKFTYLHRKGSKEKPKNHKGDEQRDTALDWLMENYDSSFSAVVYFTDDDNAYSFEIFEQLRYTKKLSIWPVGLSGCRDSETPLVENGKVVGFSAWNAKNRRFPTDFAGFAVNFNVLWKYHPMRFRKNTKPFTSETSFLELCCTREDIEPLADNCTKVLVWHTKTTIDPCTNTFGNLYV